MHIRHILHTSMDKVFAGSFVFFVHLALIVYINSSFLGSLFSDGVVSMLFTAGSILTIIGLTLLPYALRRLGARRILFGGMGVAILALAGLAFIATPWIIAILFSIYFMMMNLVLFGIDIFIEDLSPVETMGRTRGTFLVLKHVALMLIPLGTGFIITAFGFPALYGLASVAVLASLILFWKIKKFKEPSYRTQSVFSTMHEFKNKPTLRTAFMATLMLRFFLSSMIIYVPLYLVGHIGLSWEAMGTLISIMLLAFVILDYPMGRLADNPKRVPWLATLGIIIIVASVAMIGVVTTDAFWVWALILFMTRVGASMTEVMVEAFFFKHIDNDNIPAISLFRDTVPLAYIMASLFGAAIITYIPINYIFIGIALIMLYGIRYSVQLRT